MRNKIDEFTVILEDMDCDIALINEHWLLKDELTYYNPKGYKIASAFCRENDPHGGTAIVVRENIEHKVVDVSMFSEVSSFEVAAVLVEFWNTVFISIYRTPKSNIKLFFNYLEDLLSYLFLYKPKCRIVLGGDFNLDFKNEQDNNVIFLKNILSSYDLFCTNSTATRETACLDNVVTNFVSQKITSGLCKDKISDHSTLWVKINIQSLPSSQKNVFYESRNVNPDNVESFKHCLASIDWNSLGVYFQTDAEKAFNMFFNVLVDMFNECCPVVCRKVRSTPKTKYVTNTWYDNSLRNQKKFIMSLKDILDRDVNNLRVKELYIKSKNSYKINIRQAKLGFNEKKINEAKNKCLASWKIIKSESGVCTYSKKPLPAISPNVFNDYYLDIGKQVSEAESVSNLHNAKHLLENTSITVGSVLNWKPITFLDVVKVISSLKPSNAKDIYGFDNNLIKSIALQIIEPLTYLINSLLDQGIFPTLLKTSKVVPIYKKGDSKLPSNHRPISIVPILSKVIEKCVKHQLSSFLDKFNILSNNQYGFRSSLSTVKAVENAITDVLNCFEGRKFLGMTLVDLSKAFDTVSHTILLEKLSYYGIKNKELQFFESYLKERTQTVFVGNKSSNLGTILAGVPQGSVLGPLLFIIAINDLPTNLPHKSILYADDTTLIVTGKTEDEINLKSDAMMKSAEDWFTANSFFINADKTEKISFSLRITNNKEQKPVKLLGLMLDCKLTWADHTKYVVNKLSRVCFLLRKLKDNISHNMLLNSYNSFFHSHLLYGCLLWGNSPGAQQVFIWQKKALRIIAGISSQKSCTEFFVKYNILTVPCIFIFSNLVYVKENINTFQLRSSVHGHNTRFSGNIDTPYVRLSKYTSSHKYLQISMYNKLPLCVKDLEINCFKNHLSKLLTEKAFYSVEEFFKCEIT